MTFRSRWSDWEPPHPADKTDETTPAQGSVSFVGGSPHPGAPETGITRPDSRCRVCDEPLDAYLPDGTPVCERHSIPDALPKAVISPTGQDSSEQLALLSAAKQIEAASAPSLASDAPRCSDCGDPMYRGTRCWRCSYALCWDCGGRTTSPLAPYCAVCQVKPRGSERST